MVCVLWHSIVGCVSNLGPHTFSTPKNITRTKMTSVRLARDLARLLEGQLDHDVVVKVGQGDDAKEFPAHAGLLRARSAYFDVALSNRWVQANQGQPTVFEKADISPA